MTTATKPAARTKTPSKATPAKAAPKATPVEAVAPKEQPAKPAPTSLVEALTTGQTTLVKVRSNKTRRSLPYLAQGTKQRAEAEEVAKMKADGRTVEAIAEALKVSNATARRFLTNLALAHAVEAGDHDAAWTPGTKDVVVHTVVMKATAAA